MMSHLNNDLKVGFVEALEKISAQMSIAYKNSALATGYISDASLPFGGDD